MAAKPVDFRETAQWRIFRIMSEFIDGFEFLTDLKKEVTIFGSARFVEGDKYYDEARKMGRLLAKGGYTVVTGGGPGIMEAANRGAHEGKGVSIGLNIQLPYEQRMNEYVGRGIGFHYFFTRKVMLSASAQAYIYFPGGFGTLDELFEIVTLIQTKKIVDYVPVIIVGKDFWKPLMDWIDATMKKEHKTISPEDTKLYHLVDTAKEAMEIVKKSKERPYY